MTIDLADPMTRVLATFKRPEAQGWDDAWAGLEPTFQSKKSIRMWQECEDEDAYFEDDYMLGVQKKVARAVAKRWRRHDDRTCCIFADLDVEKDRDQWQVRRRNLVFRWPDPSLEPFVARFTLDPETFEYSIKPVPLAWFYDERFVRFLQTFLWDVPLEHGLSVSMAHGGAQFSLSAKTYLRGSLLADDIADKLNRPELSTWIMDWPNPDDRAFRATGPRFAAFRKVLEQYWAGSFHPKATGVLTAEHAYLDRGFEPGPAQAGLVDPKAGPTGTPRDIFQTNFVFGRAVRLRAQAVHPGYWQASHPKEEGYRPDQIMRYSEGNLNRLQICGELHVKSGKVMEPARAPELTAPLDLSMLTTEASWENRAQMSKTSARDFVEALLLDVHSARWLEAHPHVQVKPSLLQDQLLGDAEKTLAKHAPAILERLKKEARAATLETSKGRFVSDRIEPEPLFWASWHALPAGEKAAIAREAIGSFLERVERAASVDPRGQSGDLMEWHRHRPHPLLRDALAPTLKDLPATDPVRRDTERYLERRDMYLARRPQWSQTGSTPPWEETA